MGHPLCLQAANEQIGRLHYYPPFPGGPGPGQYPWPVRPTSTKAVDFLFFWKAPSMTSITDPDAHIALLTERVRRLERCNRRVTWLAGAAGMLFLALSSVGLVKAAGDEVVAQKLTSSEVATQKLTLVDPAG